MKWAKFDCGVGGGGDSYAQKSLALPTEYFFQIDIYFPASTLHACSDGDLGGFSALFFQNGIASSGGVALFDNNYPHGAWKWNTDAGLAGSATSGTTYTLKVHVNGTSISWFLDGVPLNSRTETTSRDGIIIGGFSSENCSCEWYFITNVKVGTTDGGSDIFSDDFSGGDFSNWTSVFGTGASVVDAPSECVPPTIVLHPPNGCWGSTITVVGTGFTPDSPIAITYNSQPVAVATTDGSGDFTVSFVGPPGNFSGNIDVQARDGEGNFAIVEFDQCCNRAADTIDTALPPQLGPAGGLFGESAYLDYIHHDGAHWFAYQDTSQDVANKTILPPPTNHTINVYRVPDDGSGITVYPVDSDYAWAFDNRNTNFVECGVWQTCIVFTGWDKPIHDFKFASDGVNLWFGLVSEHTVLYPYISSDDGHICGLNHYPSQAAQFIDLATLTSGFTNFPTTCAGGFFLRYFQLAVGALDAVRIDPPYSDAGDSYTGYWNQPYLAVYAFNGGGFSLVDTEDAKYCPGAVAAVDVAIGKGSLIGSVPGQPYYRPGRQSRYFSGVAMSASPNEVGVCHSVWNEGGAYGRYGGPGSYPAGVEAWDGNATDIQYRVVYNRWSSGAKTLSNDIFGAYTNRRNLFYTFDLSGGGHPGSTGYTFPPPSLPFWGGTIFQIRNDGGIPLLFLANLTLSQQGTPDPDGDPDQDWTPNYAEPTMRAYDLSSGGPVALATVTPDLLPTVAELDTFGLPGTPVVPTRLEKPWAEGFNPSVVAIDTNPSGFSVSLVYNDPTAGALVYLVAIPWGQTDSAILSASFYRIHADGTGLFDYLDGLRFPRYSIIAARGPLGPLFPDVASCDTFVSDTRNVWFPSGQLDRICNPVWQGQPNFPIHFGSGIYQAGDVIYFASIHETAPVTGIVAQAHICRACDPCNCAESGGVHVSKRVHFGSGG